MRNKKNASAYLALGISTIALIGLTGCPDVKYNYDIPESQADCPTGTEYRSGGTSVRDRSGGTSVRDRNNDEVMDYCEATTCPGGVTPTGEPVMEWHLADHGMVTAKRVCPATPPPP
jgi:hypothetical protein